MPKEEEKSPPRAILRERLYVPAEYVTQEMKDAWFYLVPDPDPEGDKQDKVPVQLYREYNDGAIIGFCRGDLGKIRKVFKPSGIQIKDRRVCPPMSHPLEMKTELFTPDTDTQGRNQKQVSEGWREKGYGQLCCPARFGKTVTVTDIICKLGAKTLILSHQWDIISQFERTIREHTNIENIEKIAGHKLVGRLDKLGWDSIEKLDIVLSSWQSWWHPSKRHYLKEHRDTFGVIMVDECFHPEHELYTENGWKNIEEITIKDKILTFNPESNISSFEKVRRVLTKNFDGFLVDIKGNKFHTLTTPSHEQPIKRKRNNAWVLDRLEVNEIKPDCRVQLPVAAYIKSEHTEILYVEKLKIAYEADGHLLRRNKTGEYVYRFSFRRKRKIERLKHILNTIGISFTETINKRGDTNIVFKSFEELSKSLTWFDPTVSKQRNESFLKEIVLWDGWRCSTGFSWQTNSKCDAEIVSLAAFLCGRHANICDVTLSNGNKRSRVHWNKNKCWVQTDSYEKKYVPYLGPVHCVTVDSGNVITRYKNQISISGNCHLSQAECYSSVVNSFNAKYRCGNTATPFKMNELHVIIENILGPVVTVGHSKQMDCTVEYVHTDFTVKAFPKGRWTTMISRMVKDEERNNLIVKEAVEDVENGRYILITTERTEHAKKLAQMLKEQGVEAIHVVGSTAERDSVWEKARKGDVKVVVAMRRITRLGIDVPLWDTFYNIIPTADPYNYYQEISRIRTYYPNKPVPVIKDFIDDPEDSVRGAILGTMKKRNSVYMEQGFDIKNAAFRKKTTTNRLQWGRKTRKD